MLTWALLACPQWHTRSFKQPYAAGLVTTAWMATLLPNHPPVISMWIEPYEGEVSQHKQGSGGQSFHFRATCMARNDCVFK